VEPLKISIENFKPEQEDGPSIKLEEITLQNTKQTGGITHNGYNFHKSGVMKKGITYYRCAQKRKFQCKSTLNIDQLGAIHANHIQHNHLALEKNKTPMAGEMRIILKTGQISKSIMILFLFRVNKVKKCFITIFRFIDIRRWAN
jgi:hypothetical protein